MEFFRKNKKALIMLAIALAVILVSSFCAALVQTDGFQVKVTDLRNETNNNGLQPNDPDYVQGRVVSGILFVPKTATEKNPAPGIVLTHGYLNNRELQLQNAIELAHRGFVVITVDRGGHGNYTIEESTPALTNTNGLYDSAKYLYNLPFVDKDKIGISGHSMGGMSTAAVLAQDAGVGIISAGLMQGWDTFIAAGPDVSVGILKAKDDEFFFGSTYADGTESICREYLHSTGAADFVNVTGYGNTKDAINIENGGIYIDGQVVKVEEGTAASSPFRVIYESDEIHPLNHFSIPSAAHVTNFFYTAFGTPAGREHIKSTSEIWWIKEAFSFLGLIAFLFMLFPLISILLNLPCFASLKKKQPAEGEICEENLVSFRKGGLVGITRTVLFFLAGLATMFFGGFILRKVYTEWGSDLVPVNKIWPQDTTGNIAAWGLVSAVFGIAVLLCVWGITALVNYIAGKKGKEQTVVTNPFACAKIGLADFVKTVLFAFLVVIIGYVVVWINWGIWTVDFRIWTLDVHPFVIDMAPTMLRYTPLFLIFYLVSAIGNAGMRAKELPEWASVLINALFNSFGVLLVVIIQYATFRSTGVLWQGDMNLGYIVVFPLIPILAIATVISRYTYKRTGNVWLGALINAILFTVITVANTATSIPYAA